MEILSFRKSSGTLTFEREGCYITVRATDLDGRQISVRLDPSELKQVLGMAGDQNRPLSFVDVRPPHLPGRMG